ncbi:putative GTP-binding protein LepA [Candidatus Zinderia insecticola CARI]|uniref:Elongation factor 4 n=1 Tax=Zinderia insecticola (strain CARI) TaxID=871271 RepID=E0TIW8_ZINIC|nr:putative GTP-binding protein LepA [Candidatus Zinderia insecticola CARI]
MKNIRNFSIIAHIDHGKSTLSSRIIEFCKKLSLNSLNIKVLDSMELEKEKGITIKSRCISLNYLYNNEKYNLNLVDTPGHIDFNNELKRYLYACEGVLLIIDALKGIESQTVINYNIAYKLGLKILIVINKIDLPNINIYNLKKKIKKKFKNYNNKILKCSSKYGFGIKNIIKYIINYIPNPICKINNYLQALIIDSYFDNYLGIILIIKIFNGILYEKKNIVFLSNNFVCKIEKIGIFKPEIKYYKYLECGRIGFIIIRNKNINKINIGDTITNYPNKNNIFLKTFKKPLSQLFISIFPKNKKYNYFKESFKKLYLNDYSLTYKKEFSKIFGKGYRCGFLGILHMDIILERLYREFNIKTIITFPNINYKIYFKNGKKKILNNPNNINENEILKIKEYIVKLKIYSPIKYINSIIKLCIKNRGIQKNIIYKNNYVKIIYEIPLNEIIYNFYNNLKNITNGYGYMKYKFLKYKKSNIVKLNILLNKKKINNLSLFIHKKKIFIIGNQILDNLLKYFSKKMFNINLQISVNNKIISSKTIKSYRKNVISKCYGGDINRKNKLLKKQKRGKMKLKKYNNFKINKNIIINFLKIIKF